jgi:hypothetical protein
VVKNQLELENNYLKLVNNQNKLVKNQVKLLFNQLEAFVFSPFCFENHFSVSDQSHELRNSIFGFRLP